MASSGDRKRWRSYYSENKPHTATYVALFLIALMVLAAIAFLPETASTEGLKKFASPEELKQFIAANSGGYEYGYAGTMQSDITMVKATGAEERATDYSTTNIQVEGVDEADIVKNDGKYIYTVTGNAVAIVDAHPADTAQLVATINTTGTVHELFVNGDRLVIFGVGSQPYAYMEPAQSVASLSVYPWRETTFIRAYDIADRAHPVLQRDIVLNGTYVDSRMIGDMVYAIVTAPAYTSGGDVPIPYGTGERFPDIYYFDMPDYSYTFTNVLSLDVNDAKVVESKTFLLGYSSTLYVSQNNIYMVYQKQVRQSVIFDRLVTDVVIPVVPWDIADKLRTVQTSSNSSYEKQAAISRILQDWLASLNPEEAAAVQRNLEARYAAVQQDIAKEMEKSVVHRIAIADGAVTYTASGEVPGQPLNQFSMDEYNGYFRIATTTGEVWGSEPAARNHVYVLDSGMRITGKLEDLAPGERIYSARFMGDRAYLVTFKKIDPLFVIDLTNPQQPAVLGKLKIPGYSDYLHPYDENHIIGVGKETVEAEEGNFAWYQGIKLSLFDVSDVANPKEIGKFNIGNRGTDSYALSDHKAFLFSKSKNLLVIPVLLAEIDEAKYPGGVSGSAYGDFVWQGAYVLGVDTTSGFTLRGRVSHGGEDLAKSGFYFRSPYAIKRSLYMANTLYTVSDKMVQANDLGSLEEVTRVELPYESRPEIIVY
ncbi:MAG: beta-propeller domain-containing protein [Candidatus Aenigmarchaeota archaeon]|nr:beta-propeller domain-containing protein [Candidatus Aenigmarchaeota archaeon]